MPDLSLVIPAYVTGQRVIDNLGDVLAGFRDSGCDLELIVVDNGSTVCNGQLEAAADIYIRFDENQGYPGGVNAGLEHVSAPVSGIGSIDIVAPSGWAPLMLDTPEMVVSVLEGDEWEMKHQRRRGAYWGAMFTFPTVALETVGGMDPRFAGWADRDFGIRLAQMGLGFRRAPVTVGHVSPNHAHRALTKQQAYQAEWDEATMLAWRTYGATDWLDAVAKFRPDLASYDF